MINNTFQYLYFIMLYRIQCSLSKVQWEKHRGLFSTLLTDDEMIESSVVCTKTCSCKYDKWSLILRHLCGIRFFFFNESPRKFKNSSRVPCLRLCFRPRWLFLISPHVIQMLLPCGPHFQQLIPTDPGFNIGFTN